jgi:hypothetical protein
MGIEPVRWVHETDFSTADAADHDLLFIGLPETPELVDLLSNKLELGSKAFELKGKQFKEQSDVLFFVARHPTHPDTIVSLLHPLSAGAAGRVTVKIPHYGRYSYLAFSDGRNQVKGTWVTGSSPMLVHMNNTQPP